MCSPSGCINHILALNSRIGRYDIVPMQRNVEQSTTLIDENQMTARKQRSIFRTIRSPAPGECLVVENTHYTIWISIVAPPKQRSFRLPELFTFPYEHYSKACS